MHTCQTGDTRCSLLYVVVWLLSFIHLFHRSPGYGMMTDGTTTFVNASACTVNFLPMNAPIVFDLPNPRTT